MDRRPIPDHQKLGSEVSDQVLEKLDGVQAIQRLLTHQGIDPPAQRNPTHDREMVAGLPHAKNGCVTFGGVRLDSTGQKVKARFIHENQATAFMTGFRLQARPDLRSPTLDLQFVPLCGSRDRHLRRPAKFLQEPRDLAFVIGRTKLFFNDLSDASTSPDLAPKTVSFRPVSKEVRDQPNLFGLEFWGTAGNRVCQQCSRAIVAGPSQPPADGSLADTERDGDLPLAPAGLTQRPGTHPPPLPPISWLETTRFHALL